MLAETLLLWGHGRWERLLSGLTVSLWLALFDGLHTRKARATTLARSGRKSLECRYVSPAFEATRHNLTSDRKSTCLASLATECRPQTPGKLSPLCDRLAETRNLARLFSVNVTRSASLMCLCI